MTAPNHVRDSAGNIVHIVTESTVDAHSLYSPVFYDATVGVAVESVNGTANSTSPQAIAAAGLSLLSSTVTSTGYFVLGAPSEGVEKKLTALSVGSTYPAYAYTNSTGVVILSTAGTSGRYIKLAAIGDSAILTSLGSTAWALSAWTAGVTVGTT